MKSLTKLRLINWHYFANTTTPISNITFLTGPNGAGKSTIIDALQIVILGSTAPSNFNKAAHEKGKSGRNLISYLRGKAGEEGDGRAINVRTGVFTSYIAIEIYDDISQKTVTLGILFDVDQSDNPDKHFFYINSPFPENDFSTEKNVSGKSRPMSYKEFSSYLLSHYSKDDYQFFTTDSEYREFSKGVFGNLSENYFSLFKQAVAFAPISNITDFITQYIWNGEVQIDIEPMQKNIEQYRILEVEAKRLNEKKEALEKMSSIYEEYIKRSKEFGLLSYLHNRVNYERSLKKVEALKKELEKDKERFTEVGDLISKYDYEINELNTDLGSYQAKIYQSDNYSIAEKISIQKDNLAGNITTIQMAIEQVKSNIKNYALEYMNVTSELVDYYKNFDSTRLKDEKITKDFDSLITTCEDISLEARNILDSVDNNTLDFVELGVFKENMNMLNEIIVSFKSAISDKIYNIRNQLISLQNDLSAVNSGKKPFERLSPNYIAIKNELESTLKSRHPDAKLDIFCDLVDVIDPEWQMAIEAVLFNQKFNFFVNPEYYDEAHKILKELSNTYNYFNVSIIDTERLLRTNLKVIENSVSELVESSRKDAQAYADYILGPIKKCTTFEEARNSGYGLLSDCTGYRSFGTWYLNKNNARVFFLGTKVSSSTVSSSASEYKEVSNLSDLYADLKEKIIPLTSLSVISENEFNSYKTDLEKSREIGVFQSRLDSLDEEMKNVGKGDYSDAKDKISDIDKKIKEINSQRDQLSMEKGSLTAKISLLETKDIPLAEQEVSGFFEILKKEDEEIVNSVYEPFFNKLIDEEGKTLAQIQAMASEQIVPCENSRKQAQNNIRRLRTEYVNKYHVNYNVENIESNEEFEQELIRIAQVQLPSYQEKIRAAHEASIKEFKDDFVYKLRTSIESVTSRINELNEILKESSFGRDVYQFSVTPSRGYREYYNMIMDELLLKTGDAEILFMEKYKDSMNELFNLISSSNASSANEEEKAQIIENIKKFTSYTTYIDFDLFAIRKVGDDVERISLGRSYTAQSGGETQTPFYISIFASFASLARTNNGNDNNTLRLVIFDEAFSKMDADRIKKSVDLLRQFGLQVIISTPPEKLSDLINFVDLILVTISDSKKRLSDLDIYRKKGENDTNQDNDLENNKYAANNSSENIADTKDSTT